MAYFTFESMKVSLKREEMWTIMWSFAHEIRACKGDSHYRQHPQSFEDNMKDRIRLGREFAKALGHPDIIESEIKEFEEWRKELIETQEEG